MALPSRAAHTAQRSAGEALQPWEGSSYMLEHLAGFKCVTKPSHLHQSPGCRLCWSCPTQAAAGAAGLCPGKERHPGIGLLATPNASGGPCYGQGLAIQPGSQATSVRHRL